MRWPLLVLVLSSCVLGAFMTGCGEDIPPPSKETQEQSSRLKQIRDKSGGDWEKLTPEDKEYLVKTLSDGSEATARMLLGPPKGPHGPDAIKGKN